MALSTQILLASSIAAAAAGVTGLALSGYGLHQYEVNQQAVAGIVADLRLIDGTQSHFERDISAFATQANNNKVTLQIIEDVSETMLVASLAGGFMALRRRWSKPRPESAING